MHSYADYAYQFRLFALIFVKIRREEFMRKISTLFIVLMPLLLITPNRSYSQFTFKMGPFGGANFNIVTNASSSQTPTGFGVLAGVQFDMNFSSSTGIIFNVAYDDKTASNSEDGRTPDGTPYTLDRTLKLTYISIEPLFKLRLPGSGFYFAVGPSVGFSIKNTAEQTLKSQNNDVTFETGERSISGDFPDVNTRFEAKLGMGMNIYLGEGVFLAPQIFSGYPITSIQKDQSERIISVQGSVAIKFTLF
jgi:hypothetical protein